MLKFEPPRSEIGPIFPEALYPLHHLQARSGLGKAAFRTLRSAGLPIYYVGGRGFVFGRDFTEFVMKRGRQEKSSTKRKPSPEQHDLQR